MFTGVFSCEDDSFVSIMGYYIGNMVGACLYGALSVQLYRYYLSFPKDQKPLKAVIYIIYIAETIFTVLIVYGLGASIYAYSVNFGRGAFNLYHVVCSSTFPTTQILGVCGAIVAFLTQSMYAYRIRIITKLKYLPWIIILVMASQLLAIIITSIRTGTLFWVTIAWTSMSMIIDLTIMSIMIWSLKKDEIYSKRLRKQIARLVYLILGTGLLTAATNLCILILVLFESTSGYSYGLLVPLSKLYANSMMVLVNSRIPSTRSETDNRRSTLDIVTIQLGSFHTGGLPSQAATDVEHVRQREIISATDSKTRKRQIVRTRS